MTTLFECKVKYVKVLETTGKEKMVTENLLLRAVSFTDAEQKIHSEMGKIMTGDFQVVAIKRSNISDIISSGDGIWYKGKVTFQGIDDNTEKQKKIVNWVLVLAENVDKAFDEIKLEFSQMTVDFIIEGITDSKIVEYFE